MALSAVVTASCMHHHHHHHHSTIKSTANHDATTSWYQISNGNATVTRYSDCQFNSCGFYTYGHSAALNLRSFGAWESAGGACGLCFKITPTFDPYTPDAPPPLGNPTVVRITNLCPFSTNPKPEDPQWCRQTTAEPLNKYGSPVHFDLCDDQISGAAAAFFDDKYRLSHGLPIRGALAATYEQCICDECWSGSLGQQLWPGACMDALTASSWPAPGGCPNVGTPP